MSRRAQPERGTQGRKPPHLAQLHHQRRERQTRLSAPRQAGEYTFTPPAALCLAPDPVTSGLYFMPDAPCELARFAAGQSAAPG